MTQFSHYAFSARQASVAPPAEEKEGAEAQAQKHHGDSTPKGRQSSGASSSLSALDFQKKLFAGDTSLLSELCEIQVILGGASRFVGVQKGLKGLKDGLVLFQSEHGTTLSVPLSTLQTLGAEAVRRRLRLAEEEWQVGRELDAIAWG